MHKSIRFEICCVTSVQPSIYICPSTDDVRQDRNNDGGNNQIPSAVAMPMVYERTNPNINHPSLCKSSNHEPIHPTQNPTHVPKNADINPNNGNAKIKNKITKKPRKKKPRHPSLCIAKPSSKSRGEPNQRRPVSIPNALRKSCSSNS